MDLNLTIEKGWDEVHGQVMKPHLLDVFQGGEPFWLDMLSKFPFFLNIFVSEKKT